VHTHGSLVGLIGRIAAFCAGIPIVIHQVHGFHHHDAMHFIKRWFYIYAERALSFLTDKLLFQSVEALEECLRLHIARRRKTDLIYNGICLDSFLDEWQEASVGRIILCVARFDSVKNHSMLFEAAKLLKERGTAFELWLCGTGVLETKYRKWVTDNCLEKNVIFMGYRDDIHELMDKANLCVLTSYKEGIAKTIMEAAAAGKPIVTTDVKGNREAVIDGITGFLIRLNDIVTLADKMAQLLNDENLRKKMGLNAKNYARKHFDEVEVVARITRVYTEMYTSKVSPPSQARGNGRLFEM
jgi:glycosyltransferase involved in cell wall biosynthesis